MFTRLREAITDFIQTGAVSIYFVRTDSTGSPAGYSGGRPWMFGAFRIHMNEHMCSDIGDQKRKAVSQPTKDLGKTHLCPLATGTSYMIQAACA